MPVAVITYNTYTYSLQDVLLTGSKKTVQALRQSQRVSTQDLYDVSSVKVTQAMGQGADDFTLEFSNYLGKYTDFFTPFQEIEIRIGFPTDPNNIIKEELPLLMVGLIEDAEPTYTKGEGWKIAVTGRNYASLLLDAKLTDQYKGLSASSIVQDIIDEYGLGLAANISASTTQHKYEKTIRTAPKAASAMQGRVQANLQVSVADSAIINKTKTDPVVQTVRYADDWLFRGSTAWSAIEHLAYLEATNDPEYDGREFVTYYDGKTFHFGPRMNANQDPSTMVQIVIGENVEHYKFRISTTYLHTRVKITTRLKKNGQITKGIATVTAPDNLVVGVDLTQQEMDGFTNAQSLFGIREIVLKDRDKVLGTDVTKMKWLAKAKLKEYSRLVYTGDMAIVFTADLGNDAIEKMTKDRGIVIYGVEAVGGSTVTGFDQPQSRRYNGIFYIEKAGHSFNKANGYRIDMSLSSRSPEMAKALGETTISSQNTVIKKPSSPLTDAQVKESTLQTN